MSKDGLRKSKKIKTLTLLNEKYNLGLKDIDQYSTSQLARMIYTIKTEKGLTIKSSTKDRRKIAIR